MVFSMTGMASISSMVLWYGAVTGSFSPCTDGFISGLLELISSTLLTLCAAVSERSICCGLLGI